MQLTYTDPDPLGFLPAETGRSRGWEVAQLTLARRIVKGGAHSRRLCLWLDALLSGRSPGDELPIRLYLESDAWPHEGCWPPFQEAETTTAAPPCAGCQPLAYRIDRITRRESPRSDEGFWQKMIRGESRAPEQAIGVAARPLTDSLLEAVTLQLAALDVGTVGGALEFIDSGSVGCHGPVARQLLERSGQADLAIDATRIAEADDAADHGGEAQLLLALYGDRHGAWVLHRRRLQPRKVRRNDQAPEPIYSCDVILADSAAELRELAGMGRTEKELYQRADILPTEDLRAHYLPDDTGADAGARGQSVELAQLDPRSRRYMDAIALLARDKRLTAVDLDTLLRVARQMARH
jgi:hypothetical protein